MTAYRERHLAGEYNPAKPETKAATTAAKQRVAKSTTTATKRKRSSK